MKVQETIAITPRILGMNLITTYILNLHELGYLDMYILFPKGVSLLKVQEKIATTPRVLEMNPITIYILKLHKPGYLDEYILFSKSVSS